MSAGVDERATDTELACRFKRDPEEFHAVYDRYHRAVYLYVAGRLDVQAADDLAAETFLIAFGRRDRFDPERGELRPWLFGIATNLVARHRRKEAQHYRALARRPREQEIDSHENRVVTSVAAQRMQPQLALALTRLTRGERDVVLLMALAQLTHEEIAEALGISYGTVGSRLSRARKKLRPAIDKEAFHG
ncbi:RNA polymerase sigma factor [Actinomadura barringtoniae]|uniref:RNA polymerase sigma factor n=1 Tax=Actinomadura barringtoniae TaxID=1427535 RepID=A0A939PGB4_9ACTN|nr:RNA polymerase sigma factor [Actinomadura barringtoniae]MBO2452000.1 RNA polymerase sigma factor [Actinomadura barringtoniae]